MKIVSSCMSIILKEEQFKVYTLDKHARASWLPLSQIILKCLWLYHLMCDILAKKSGNRYWQSQHFFPSFSSQLVWSRNVNSIESGELQTRNQQLLQQYKQLYFYDFWMHRHFHLQYTHDLTLVFFCYFCFRWYKLFKCFGSIYWSWKK